MNTSLWKRASLLWLLFLLIATSGGILRVAVLQQWVGELSAEWLEGTLLIFVFVWFINQFVSKRTNVLRVVDTIWLGAFWCGLTMAFEFLFFRFVTGHSWQELFANYRVDQGRIWVLVLLSLLVSPLLSLKYLTKKL